MIVNCFKIIKVSSDFWNILLARINFDTKIQYVLTFN